MDEPMRHLERIAAELRRYSDQGEHRRIPGPSAGRAYELALEIEMCVAALSRSEQTK